MKSVIECTSIIPDEQDLVGEEALVLAGIARQGLPVPLTLCITTHAYRRYLTDTGLVERIFMELSRNDFMSLKWEELWDVSLRIRNMFLNTPMPRKLRDELRAPIDRAFGDDAVCVRVSMPGAGPLSGYMEGLAEGETIVKGSYAILDHIRVLWSSLFSDRSLKSLRDLGMDVRDVSMAVLVQKAVPVDAGVAAACSNGLGSTDNRPWSAYGPESIHDLDIVRSSAKEKVIPEIRKAADQFSARELERLTDADLAEELSIRFKEYRLWEDISLENSVALAHGMALFGYAYNDALRPLDPNEFMDLLPSKDMATIRGIAMLEQMADLVRKDEKLAQELRYGGRPAGYDVFSRLLGEFMLKFGDSSYALRETASVLRIVLELAKKQPSKAHMRGAAMERLMEDFFSYVPEEFQESAADYLKTAQDICRLRDEGSIHMGRLKNQMEAALQEGRKRLSARGFAEASCKDVIRALKDPECRLTDSGSSSHAASGDFLRIVPRQLMGHPVGRGIASGLARVYENGQDLSYFRTGEILVIDTLDASNAFVIPMAGAVVVEQGGMLVHGAILAREYGLPCVTGVRGATRLIRTGDRITLDGHTGLVIIEPREEIQSGYSTKRI